MRAFLVKLLIGATFDVFIESFRFSSTTPKSTQFLEPLWRRREHVPVAVSKRLRPRRDSLSLRLMRSVAEKPRSGGRVENCNNSSFWPENPPAHSPRTP